LCLLLILVIISFVATVTFVKDPTTCSLVGNLLHYFVLALFCFMLVQTVNLYRAIVLISVRRTDCYYFKAMVFAAIGKKYLFGIFAEIKVLQSQKLCKDFQGYLF